MRTTIDLPDDLFRQVKARAALDGLKLKELITRYVQEGLRADASVAPPGAHSVPRRHSELPPPRPGIGHPIRARRELPIAQPATGRPLRALTNAELYEILDEEDAARILGLPEARSDGNS